MFSRASNGSFLVSARKSRSAKMPLGAPRMARAEAGLGAEDSWGTDAGLSHVLQDEFGFGNLRLLRDTTLNGHRHVDFDAGGLGRICVSVTEQSVEKFELVTLEEGRSSPQLDLPQAIPTKLGNKVALWLDGSGEEKRVSVSRCCKGMSWKDARPKTSRVFETLGAALGDVCHSNLIETGALDNGCSTDVDDVADFLKTFALHDRKQLDKTTIDALNRFASLEASVPSHIFRSTVGFTSSNAFLVGEDSRLGVVGLSHVCDVVQCSVVEALAKLVGEAVQFTADPLAAACFVVKGFHDSCPLQENELAHLYALVGTGLGSLIVHGRSGVESETTKLARIGLAKWAKISPSIAHYAFRDACDFEPCPHRHSFDAWVERNQGSFSSMFDFDMNEEPRQVFDFGVEGMALKYLECLDNVEMSARHVRADMSIAGCRYGVGRYLEPRLVYTSEAYMAMGIERPITRTVHLGIDLFVEAGAPVRTPVAGVVHSFQDNADDRDYGPTVILEHKVAPELTFYSLFGHLSRESLERKEVGMHVGAGEVIGWVGALEVNGGWAPHVHFQLMLDMCDCKGDFVGGAYPHMKRVYASLCPDPNSLLGMKGGGLDVFFTSVADTIAKREELLGNHQVMLFGKTPLRLVRGFMQYLYDDQGRHFLDMYNNVQHVGHQNPRVVRAGQQQMETLNVNSRYLNDNLIECAEELVATMPEPLQVCYFVNSGSEANELALRLARCYTGRRDMIVVEGGYHGNTSGCAALSSYKFDKPGGGGPEDWVHVLPLPDSYRGMHQGADSGPRYVDGATTMLRDLEGSGVSPCGFICEGVLSCAGQIVPPTGYLQGVYGAVRRYGGVCIADEVQTGFGRVGSHYWAFQTHGVLPDIVTLGKPMGNGHPIGAVVTTRDIAEAFSEMTGYFNTFGGNPVSARVALEVMEVVRQENLQEHAGEMGLVLEAGLCGLRDRHAVVGDVRGLGLFWGIEFVEGRNRTPAKEHASYVMERLKDCGILVGVDGMQENVVKIKPPLVVTKADIATFLEAFEVVLNDDFMQLHPEK